MKTLIFTVASLTLMLFSHATHAAQLAANGLMVYSSVANYVEVYEYTSISKKNLFDSLVIRPNGQSFSLKTEGILAVLNYPPIGIAPGNEEEAQRNIQNIVALQQRYPKFKVQLQLAESRWKNALEMGKQMKLKEPVAAKPSPGADTLSFTTTDGRKFEDVTLSGTDSTGVSVLTDSGVLRIDFEQLPPQLQQRFHFDASKAAALQEKQNAAKQALIIIFTTTNRDLVNNTGTEGNEANADAQRALRGENPALVEWLQKSANHGDAQAQFVLACMYCKGNGIPKNGAKAVQWLLKSAIQGNVAAQYKLGEIYALSEEDQDKAKAIEWLKKAGVQGCPGAQCLLGAMYAKGIGVAKDSGQAFEWSRKAAIQGDARAQYNLAGMYADGDGTSKDTAAAREWLEKSANQGYVDALAWLGVAYSEGSLGISADTAKGFDWLQKAAIQGHAKSQLTVANEYLIGKKIPKDEAKAFEWHQKAAFQGNVIAQKHLGETYVEGIGIPKDKVRAYAWYSLAAAMGSSEASQSRDEIESLLTAEELANAKALSTELSAKIYKKSSEQPVYASAKRDSTERDSIPDSIESIQQCLRVLGYKIPGDLPINDPFLLTAKKDSKWVPGISLKVNVIGDTSWIIGGNVWVPDIVCTWDCNEVKITPSSYNVYQSLAEWRQTVCQLAHNSKDLDEWLIKEQGKVIDNKYEKSGEVKIGGVYCYFEGSQATGVSTVHLMYAKPKK